MAFSRDDIKRLSVSYADEVLPDDGGFTPPIASDQFDDLLDESARWVITHVDRQHLLNIATVVENNTALVTENTDGTGVITLPSTFVRFLSLKMSDWNRPVTSLVNPGTEQYDAQFVKGIRGSRWKPIAALSQSSGSVPKIEYFSTQADTHTISRLEYVLYTVAEQMPDALIDGMCWLIASRLLVSLQHEEAANAAMGKAQESLGLKVGLEGE